MNHLLLLPQLRCTFKNPLPEKQIFLVAGGKAPDTTWLKKAVGTTPLWCADHGIDACMKANLKPHHVVGDGDSATTEGWAWAKSLQIPVDEYPPEKDLTDLQLTLQKIGKAYGEASVILTGVWGGRFDHAFSNIFSLKGAAAFGINGACAADEKEVLIFLKGSNNVHIKTFNRPEVISLLPLSSECTGLSIDGVHWPLDHVILKNTLPYAISNSLTPSSNEFHVTVKDGWVGIYLYWK